MEGWLVMGKIILTAESETLCIPLYSRAEMSREGKIFSDKKSEEIVNSIDYDFSKNKTSKYLNIYMGIRAAIIDDYTNKYLKENPDAIVLHLGCGLDSRIDRIVNKMGATIRWGLDSPHEIEKYADGIKHFETKYFTNDERIERLSGFTKFMFKLLYSNNIVKNLYQIYVFKIS